MLLVTGWHAIVSGTLFDPDDELRLVQVRDLLAGQPWWDMAQHRINPAAGGVTMHWSRIVDLPLAAGLMALRPLTGTALAETIMLALWPLVTLAAVFAMAARTYARLGRNEVAAIALILVATDHFILFQLSPMRIDHHGWQILLGLGLMANALAAPSLRNGVIGGLAAAVLLAISLEGLPIVALFAAMAAVEWWWSGSRDVGLRLTGYLASLAASAAVLQFLTRGPIGLTVPWCDSLSVAYLAAFGAAAVAFATGFAAVRVQRSFAARAVLLVITAIAAVAALLAAAPMCTSGPFAALDPIVVRYWYARVPEGQPVWAGGLGQACYTLIPSLIGLIGIAIGWRQALDPAVRRRWALVGVAGLAAVTLSILVLRTGSTAHAIVMPGCAVVGIALWQWSRRQTMAVVRVLGSLSVLVAVPAAAGVAGSWAIARLFPDGRMAAALAEEQTPVVDLRCLTDADAERLNRLPAETMLTPLDLGPLVVRKTHHSVVATGHHRNNAAMAATIATFVSPASQARTRMRPLGATMIMICLKANDLTDYAAAPGRALADDLVADHTYAWLEPVPMGRASQLRVWRVAPVASAPRRH